MMMATDGETETPVSIDSRLRPNSPANSVSSYVDAGHETLRSNITTLNINKMAQYYNFLTEWEIWEGKLDFPNPTLSTSMTELLVTCAYRIMTVQKTEKKSISSSLSQLK